MNYGSYRGHADSSSITRMLAVPRHAYASVVFTAAFSLQPAPRAFLEKGEFTGNMAGAC